MTKIQKHALTQRKKILAKKERIKRLDVKTFSKRKYIEKHKETYKMKKIRNTSCVTKNNRQNQRNFKQL
jgi:hypothetical protein